jgi:hypothetical protein
MDHACGVQYRVLSGGLLGFGELVAEYGQSAPALLDAAGLPPTELHDPDLYRPCPARVRLLTRSARRCQAPDFGVRPGRRQRLEVIGALGTWLCMQARVADALPLLNPNLGFRARGLSVDVEARGRQVSLELRLAFAGQTDCAQLLGLSMALLARSVAQLHGTGLRPSAVDLALPQTRGHRGWHVAFTCSPAFGTSHNRMV